MVSLVTMVTLYMFIELSRLEEDLLKSPKEKLQCVINAVIIIISILLTTPIYILATPIIGHAHYILNEFVRSLKESQ